MPRCSVIYYPRPQGRAPIRRVRGIAALAGIMCLTGASSSFDNPGSAPLGYEMTLLSGPPDPTARPALVQVADNVVSAATRLSVDGQPKLLITAAAEVAGEAVRTISVDVGDLGEFSFGHLPEGWTGVVDQGWATLSGPAIDAERLFARFDLQGLPDLADLAVSLRSEVTSLLDFSAPMEQLPPLRLARALEDVLHFPWQVRPGEAVQMQVASAALTPSGGVWEIAGVEPTALAASGPGADRLTMEIPESLQRGSEIPVQWTDPFGELVVDIPNAEILITGPPAGQTMTPNLRDCTPTGFSDRVICVCGWFPDEESQQGLLFDGQPLGPPAAASSQSVLIRIPAGTPPGTHTISGDPEQGFPADSSVNVLVLAVTGRVDQEKLALGEVTPLHLEIQGDTKPLEIVLTNRNPYTVAVTGGVVQTLTTSGGTPNTVSTDVRGISPGQFAIHYKLGEDPCPCAGGGTRTRTVVAEDPPVDVPPPPEPTPDPTGDPPQQGDSTRTRPPEGDSTRTGPPTPPLPPVPPAVPVPPEDPPVVPPEEEEEEPCCGFGHDGTLTFPNITDPLVPAGTPVAPRDPAVGGFQVLLHSGAYFHNELDLEVDAVGLPFRFARHYKGDVETVAGGLLGGRWDHSLNKRIVPQASQDAGNGLRRERPQFEAAQLWYFDGQGRGAPYEGPSSEWREVLNFGRAATFRAYVTTFTPHPGDFYEIQRYVLEDPSEHPFIDHPAVDRAHGEAIFYVLRERNGVRYIFNCRGQLILVLHRNDFTSLAGAGVRQPADSVRITLRYDGPLNPLTQNRVLSEVEDPTGKKYAFRTEPIGTAPLDTNIDCAPQRGTLPIPRLSEIQGAGRLLRFAYGSGGSGDPILRSVTDSVEAQVRDSLPQGPNAGHSRTTRYGYDASDRLVSVTSPKEVYGASRPYLINGYDGAGRVTSQIFGDSSSINAMRTTISYGANAATVRNAKGEETEYALEIIGEFPVVRTQTVRGTGGGPNPTGPPHTDTTHTRRWS